MRNNTMSLEDAQQEYDNLTPEDMDDNPEHETCSYCGEISDIEDLIQCGQCFTCHLCREDARS